MKRRPFALPSWPRVHQVAKSLSARAFLPASQYGPFHVVKRPVSHGVKGRLASRFGLCRCLPCRGARHWGATVGGCGSLRPCLFGREACHAGVATRHRIAGFRLAASHGRGGWGLRCRSRFRFLLQSVLGLPECAFAQPHYFADVFLLFV